MNHPVYDSPNGDRPPKYYACGYHLYCSWHVDNEVDYAKEIKTSSAKRTCLHCFSEASRVVWNQNDQPWNGDPRWIPVPRPNEKEMSR